jgi:hypothetical protein
MSPSARNQVSITHLARLRATDTTCREATLDTIGDRLGLPGQGRDVLHAVRGDEAGRLDSSSRYRPELPEEYAVSRPPSPPRVDRVQPVTGREASAGQPRRRRGRRGSAADKRRHEGDQEYDGCVLHAGSFSRSFGERAASCLPRSDVCSIGSRCCSVAPRNRNRRDKDQHVRKCGRQNRHEDVEHVHDGRVPSEPFGEAAADARDHLVLTRPLE